jgi:hypothetical protein
MRALVVYESMFGNNAAVAEAVAAGLATAMPVEVLDVRDAPVHLPDDVALLVVGAPNHVTGLPRPSTRRDAASKGADVTDPASGVREWLADLELPAGTLVAAFDTRMAKPALIGLLDHAARSIGKELRSQGGEQAAPAEHFTVESERGPLTVGELDRARAWGRELAEEHHR